MNSLFLFLSLFSTLLSSSLLFSSFLSISHNVYAVGSRQTPAGGFAQLEGFNGGKHRFTIYKDSSKRPDALPTAHACLCTIDLPEYESREQLVEKIRVAVVFGSVGMHDPAMADDDEQEEEEKDGQDGQEVEGGARALQQ